MNEELIREIERLKRRMGAIETVESTVDRWQGAINARLSLPGLRGLWPMSAFDGSGNATDLSGQARHLTYNGNPTYNVSGLAPYLALDGTGDYLSRTSEAGLNITGTESYVASALRGLTVVGWFYLNDVSGTRALITKWGSAPLQAYYLDSSAGTLRFIVSSDGTATTTVSASGVISAGQWFLIGARFEPSTRLKLWYNNATAENTTSIPASIASTLAAFQIGQSAIGDSRYLNGRASLVSLHAAALSDAILAGLFQQERVLFGV